MLRNVILKSLGAGTNATGLILAKQLTTAVKTSDTIPKNNTDISEGKRIKPTSVSASSFIVAPQKSQASKVKASYNSETSPNSNLSSSSGIGSAPEAEEEEETEKYVRRAREIPKKTLPDRKATTSSNEVTKSNPVNAAIHESVRKSSDTLKLQLQQYYPLKVGKKNDYPTAFSAGATTCSPGNPQLPINEGKKGFHSKQAEVEAAAVLWEQEQQKLSNEITSLSLRTKEQTLQ